MIRLTHLITSLEGGGTENFLWQLLRAAPAQVQNDVLFLKKDGIFGERIRALGVPVQRVNPLDLFAHLKKNKPQVLHTLLYRAHQMGRLIGRAAGVPFIVSSQRAIDAWQKPCHVALDRWTLGYCDLVLANSSAAEDLVRQRLAPQATAPQVKRLPNGIDGERFRAVDRQSTRRHFGWSTDWVVGGSLLRLHTEKGADLIPAYAQTLLERHPELHLAVAGEGPLAAELRAGVANKPWASRLHWLGWVDDTSQFLSAIDFCWSLSREESFPQSLLEASAAGVPWVAPSVGGVSDVKEAGGLGHLWTAGAFDTGIEATSTLINALGPEREEAARRAAQVIENSSWKQMAANFYHSVGVN